MKREDMSYITHIIGPNNSYALVWLNFDFDGYAYYQNSSNVPPVYYSAPIIIKPGPPTLLYNPWTEHFITIQVLFTSILSKNVATNYNCIS